MGYAGWCGEVCSEVERGLPGPESGGAGGVDETARFRCDHCLGVLGGCQSGGGGVFDVGELLGLLDLGGFREGDEFCPDFDEVRI